MEKKILTPYPNSLKRDDKDVPVLTIENNQLKINNDITDLLLTGDLDLFNNKFKDFLNKYYSYDDPSKMQQGLRITNNMNDDRIEKVMVLNKIFTNMNSNLPILCKSFKKIELGNETDLENKIINFWDSMHLKVIKKKKLNFPLIVFSNPFNIRYPSKKNCINLYFMTHKLYKTDMFISFRDSLINETRADRLEADLFQKILIFETLKEYGLKSSNYIFEEMNLFKETPFTFRVKDLFFTLNLKKIIILSPSTVLYKNEDDQINSYLDSLTDEENKFIKSDQLEFDSFYELLFSKYRKKFIYSIFNTKKNSLIYEQGYQIYNNKTDLKIGKIYLLKEGNEPNYIIILNKNKEHVKYLIILDSSSAATCMFSTKIKKIDDLNSIVDPGCIFNYPLTVNNFIGDI